MKIKTFAPIYDFDWRLFVLHLIYFALLLLVYSTYIVVIFGYAGYKDASQITRQHLHRLDEDRNLNCL